MERFTHPAVPDLTLEFEPENQRLFGPCACCGKMTKRVRGYVYRGEAALAAYFVEWTPGHADREAVFDLILGEWGEGTEATDRKAVSLGFRHTQDGPQFMVWNASARPVGTNPLASEALDRDQVLGTVLAAEAFAVVDLVYLVDSRIDELTKE